MALETKSRCAAILEWKIKAIHQLFSISIKYKNYKHMRNQLRTFPFT